MASIFAGCGSTDEPDGSSSDRPSVEGVSLRYGDVTERSLEGGADGRNTTSSWAESMTQPPQPNSHQPHAPCPSAMTQYLSSSTAGTGS